MKIFKNKHEAKKDYSNILVALIILPLLLLYIANEFGMFTAAYTLGYFTVAPAS